VPLLFERPLLVKASQVPQDHARRATGRVHGRQAHHLAQSKSTTKAHSGLYEIDPSAVLGVIPVAATDKVHDCKCCATTSRKGKSWKPEAEEKVILAGLMRSTKADIEFPKRLLQELDKMEFLRLRDQ